MFLFKLVIDKYATIQQILNKFIKDTYFYNYFLKLIMIHFRSGLAFCKYYGNEHNENLAAQMVGLFIIHVSSLSAFIFLNTNLFLYH